MVNFAPSPLDRRMQNSQKLWKTPFLFYNCFSKQSDIKTPFLPLIFIRWNIPFHTLNASRSHEFPISSLMYYKVPQNTTVSRSSHQKTVPQNNKELATIFVSYVSLHEYSYRIHRIPITDNTLCRLRLAPDSRSMALREIRIHLMLMMKCEINESPYHCIMLLRWYQILYRIYDSVYYGIIAISSFPICVSCFSWN